MKRVRTVHISTVHTVFDTRIFYKECRTLVNNNYEVIFIVRHKRNEIINGIVISKLPEITNKYLRMAVLPWLAFYKAIRYRADIYHLHDPELLPIGIILSWLGKDVIYDVEEDLDVSIRDKDWLHFKRAFLATYNLLLSYAARKIRFILAEKSYEKNYIGKDYAVIQNFPDHSLFENIRPLDQPKNSKYKFVYIGDIAEDRGIFIMLEALARLRDGGNSEFQFECVGSFSSHELEIRVRELIANRSLSHNVTFHGRLKAPEAFRVALGADIGFALLEPRLNYLESYTTKMFEYMLLGVPVLASNFPLWQEVIEDAECGAIVDPLNIEGVVKAINALLGKQHLGENGRVYLESPTCLCTWDAEAKKMLSFYSHAVN